MKHREEIEVEIYPGDRFGWWVHLSYRPEWDDEELAIPPLSLTDPPHWRPTKEMARRYAMRFADRRRGRQDRREMFTERALF